MGLLIGQMSAKRNAAMEWISTTMSVNMVQIISWLGAIITARSKWVSIAILACLQTQMFAGPVAITGELRKPGERLVMMEMVTTIILQAQTVA